MINCDGICMVFGIQWWIVYIAIGFVVGSIVAFLLTDEVDETTCGMAWFVAMLIWPVILIALFIIGLFHVAGSLIMKLRAVYDSR